MVTLILKYLNKIKQFFLIIPILIGIMVFAGLFFAHEKSKPEFASKAEEIMFDTKNKSPKYVMTLPEEQKKQEPSSINEDDIELAGLSKEAEKEIKPLTNNEKLNQLDIPFLAKLPTRDNIEALTYVTPLQTLLMKNDKDQRLPVQSDNLKPWEVYGRKVSVMPMFNKVAIVIKNVGTNAVNSDLIISRLPSEISLSFSPYTPILTDIVKKARENGHETYVDIILPSRDFARTDSGPLALNFQKSVNQNVQMLEGILAQDVAVGGFTVCDGVDDTDFNDYFSAIMAMLEKRGLLLLDATHGLNIGSNNVQGLDRVRADIVIDADFNRTSIREKLDQAEKKALKNGNVVVVADPKPVVVLELYNWIKTFSQQLTYDEMKAQGVSDFEKPLVLVPLSNLVGEY